MKEPFSWQDSRAFKSCESGKPLNDDTFVTMEIAVIRASERLMRSCERPGDKVDNPGSKLWH